MNQSTKIFLIIIGMLSIGVGIGFYFVKNEPVNAYFAIFIGIALIGTVIFIKPKIK